MKKDDDYGRLDRGVYVSIKELSKNNYGVSFFSQGYYWDCRGGFETREKAIKAAKELRSAFKDNKSVVIQDYTMPLVIE
jgi:hypothetical protein